jgi:hypothetical protein
MRTIAIGQTHGTKKDDPAVWVGVGIIVLALCLIGSCQQIQNRQLPPANGFHSHR